MWVQVDVSLPDHPKLIRLAQLLGVNEFEALGRLVAFWCWVLERRGDGLLFETDPLLVDRRCGQGSSDALVAAGFVDSDGQILRVHGWQEWGGKLAASREREAERGRVRRTSAGRPPAEVHRTSAGGPAAESESESEEKREEKKEESHASHAHARALAFVTLWNDNCGQLPKVDPKRLNKARKAAINSALAEEPDMNLWLLAIQARSLDTYWLENGYGIDTLIRPSKRAGYLDKARQGFTPPRTQDDFGVRKRVEDPDRNPFLREINPDWTCRQGCPACHGKAVVRTAFNDTPQQCPMARPPRGGPAGASTAKPIRTPGTAGSGQ